MNSGLAAVESIGLLKTWQNLSVQQRIMAVGGTIAMIAAFWVLVTLSSKEGEALLFSGLDPAVAGEVTAQLDGSSVPYTVKGSAIYVPASQRDRLRLELASQGLPAADSSGYELLDSLNGFSTTADMFDAAYWRAKEGELTRTIVAMPAVKSARVHLGVNRQSAFRRQRGDKSASVTVDAPMGLTEDQARSIQYLTALAIANLPPEAVAVVDTKRGLIAGPGSQGQMANKSGLDVSSRVEGLETRLTQMLEAHVGYGNARVSVSMDIDRTAVAQTERLVDPDARQIATRNTM
ncbi:MAG: flagellar basal-body MS-ring/collar protein FliF, partial [Pseudomonadota bacterium]